MKTIKCWWKKLLCLLSGGHRYAAKNLKCSYDDAEMMYNFSSCCVKCGAILTANVPEECIVAAAAAHERWQRSLTNGDL